MTRASRKSRLNNPIIPHAKLWLEADGQYAFGRGISDILKAVQQTGSIKAAADDLGKSYRFVWAKIKKTERALGTPLVSTQVGGGDSRRSALTELAEELVHEFDTLRERVFKLVHHEFRQRLNSTLKRHQEDD